MDKYKLVVFDWDGTLMGSIDRIVSSIQEAAEACQQAIPSAKQVKGVIGLSLPKVFESLFPDTTDEESTKLRTHYKYQYLEKNLTPAPLFEDALPLLKALNDNNKLVAVATGKAKDGLERVISETNTGHYFHALRCADETISKPDPQMLISLLSELNIQPEEAVMIGDSSFDLKMATAAGVDGIGITLGVNDRDELSCYQPIAIVDSLFELQQLLLPNEKS